MITPLLAALCALLLLVSATLAVAVVRLRSGHRRARRELSRLSAELESRTRERVARQVQRERQRLERQVKRRQRELGRQEAELGRRRSALAERRVKLEERAAKLDGRAEELTERAGELEDRSRALESREHLLEQSEERLRDKLEEIAGLTTEQARSRLLGEIEEEIESDVARMTHKADRDGRVRADKIARELVLRAMSTLRGNVATEGTVSVVKLPSDEMKGRIIGREGRNIRALELVTGVDLLVDDTPRAIVLSSWDPLRRTIAARALEKLVEDGRIHPARIEEVLEKTREEVDDEARQRGEDASFQLGIAGLHERLVLLLGRLSFVTDQGRTLLQRAVEVGQLVGAIAEELTLGGAALRRAGLLHEIARAEGKPMLAHPAVASADLAARYGEPSEVTEPIRALAQPSDAPRRSDAVLLVTARRLVLARPGARNQNLQRHMDRLHEVEKLACQRDGVDRALAVRAGKQLRVHVRADQCSDDEAQLMARELAREIEKRIEFPGTLRVVVLRETRAISYAV
ncbi:MAG: DUF3552 domain-containing protein [Acidobacteriota bacterium]|nr:MAG: DUF3552 domain-containing protein [Acidobacteriota bacterium]